MSDTSTPTPSAPPAPQPGSPFAAPSGVEAGARSGPAALAAPRPTDWALILLLTLFWGSSFAMISVALETLSPAVIVMLRMWIGALVLLVVAAVLRSPLPRVLPRPDPSWRWLAGVGLVGNTIPFFLIPWAQQFTPSGLSGVVIASAPLFVALLAHVFAGERLTRRRSLGLVVAFMGVMVLFAPALMAGAATQDARAVAALLVCAVLYAVTIILARFNTHGAMVGSAAGVCLIAALATTPFGVWDMIANGVHFTPRTAAAIVALGVGPSAIATILYMTVARRAGPGFLSLTNYLVPLFSVALGAALLHERLQPNAFVALGLILTGLLLSGRCGRKPQEVRSGQP